MRIPQLERRTWVKVYGVIGGLILVLILIITLTPESKEQKQERIVEEKQEAAEESEDRRKGFHCLSDVTGRHYGIETLIGERLKDPGSLQVIDTLIGPVEGGQHEIHVEYRAKNSFGALVPGYAIGLVDTNTCEAKLLSSG